MKEITRVLLIDDDESFWLPMKRCLVEEGFEVSIATNRQDAIDKAQLFNGNFHVAIIGVSDSMETMLQLRQQCPMIEIIILTGPNATRPVKKVLELEAWYIQRSTDSYNLAHDIHYAVRFGQERRRNKALQTLVKAGERLSASQNENELYLQLYEEARQLLPNLDGFLISRYAEQQQEISFPFGYLLDKRVSVPARKHGNKITEFVLRNREPLLLPDGDKGFREEHHLDSPAPDLGYCASEIAVPMFLNGQIVGTINALAYEPGVHYTQEQLQIMQAFANQAAMAIGTMKQLEEARQLRNAAMLLASQRGKQAVSQAIVEEAHKLIGSDYTGFILQEEDGTFHKVKPVIPDTYYEQFDEPRHQGGVTRYVVNTRQPKVIPNTEEDELVKGSVRDMGVRSMVAIPLIHANWVLGVLYAHTFSLRAFDSHDIDLWTAFASQAAATLSNTLEDERHIQDYLRLANELGKLNEKMKLNEAMTRVATAGKTIFESDTCRIAFVDPHANRIVDWAWADGDPEEYRCESEPRPNGVTNHIIRTRQALFQTVEEDKIPHPVPELVTRGLKSFASLPLIYGGHIIGVLHCNYLTKQRPFDEHLKTLMEAFGARAAIALGRAHRDKTIDAWHKMDQLAVASQDHQSSYRVFTETARTTLCANFAAFYPSTSVAALKASVSGSTECISVGEPPTDWNASKYNQRDKLISEIGPDLNGLLIVNDIESTPKGTYKGLKKLGKFKAFVALHLNAMIQEGVNAQQAGLLLLTYQEKTTFEANDLAGLQYAGDQLEGRILRRNLQIALQDSILGRNQQLRSVIHTLKAFLEQGRGLSLDFIAERSLEILGIDTCSLLEYDPIKTRFVQRGTAGLRFPDAPYTIPDDMFKERFMESLEPVVIMNVHQDDTMWESEHAEREEIQSIIIFPLRAEGEFLGLFFANYRKLKNFSREDKEAIGLFADLAALVLHESRLGAELNETQKRLDRHLFLVWVSMLENTWRHSIVQKASAIRNYAAVLSKQLSQLATHPPQMHSVPMVIENIDKLANDIANAPPRVPQSWEMMADIIPLRALLREVASRESKPLLQPDSSIEIQTYLEDLGNVQVSGYRRWLIYALEALFQNARNAMPSGGVISVTGTQNGSWAEIRIRDTGDGVPESIRKTLFKDITPKDQDAIGMGIGGLLVATILEEHRGTIELERPGPGDTTILICLPICGDKKK